MVLETKLPQRGPEADALVVTGIIGRSSNKQKNGPILYKR